MSWLICPCFLLQLHIGGCWLPLCCVVQPLPPSVTICRAAIFFARFFYFVPKDKITGTPQFERRCAAAEASKFYGTQSRAFLKVEGPPNQWGPNPPATILLPTQDPIVFRTLGLDWSVASSWGRTPLWALWGSIERPWPRAGGRTPVSSASGSAAAGLWWEFSFTQKTNSLLFYAQCSYFESAEFTKKYHNSLFDSAENEHKVVEKENFPNFFLVFVAKKWTPMYSTAWHFFFGMRYHILLWLNSDLQIPTNLKKNQICEHPPELTVSPLRVSAVLKARTFPTMDDFFVLNFLRCPKLPLPRAVLLAAVWWTWLTIVKMFLFMPFE